MFSETEGEGIANGTDGDDHCSPTPTSSANVNENNSENGHTSKSSVVVDDQDIEVTNHEKGMAISQV